MALDQVYPGRMNNGIEVARREGWLESLLDGQIEPFIKYLELDGSEVSSITIRYLASNA